MVALIVLLVILLVLGGLGFAAHVLWFVLIGALVLWLIAGLRFGIWNQGILMCIPIFMFLFSIYYSVSALTGIIWKSAVVSVVLSISVCAWTWRQGERYSGWLLLGFLPIHLSYPFPALRAAGVLAHSPRSRRRVTLAPAGTDGQGQFPPQRDLSWRLVLPTTRRPGRRWARPSRPARSGSCRKP